MPGDARGFDVKAAARTEREREAREDAAARDRAAQGRAEARRLAAEIAAACGPGVERVVLFGSLARGDARSREPDIDLAVWATPECFLRAVSIALGSAFRVDVVDPRTAAPPIDEAIRRDGVVLYAR